jgi:hypothetical protein
LFGIIDGLLLIRLLLKLLGSNPQAGFTSFVYGVTDVLMALLRNLVPTVGSSGAVLDVGRHRDHRLRATSGGVLARLIAIVFFRNVMVFAPQLAKHRRATSILTGARKRDARSDASKLEA